MKCLDLSLMLTHSVSSYRVVCNQGSSLALESYFFFVNTYPTCLTQTPNPSSGTHPGLVHWQSGHVPRALEPMLALQIYH